jgi:hypothetical protein
MQHSFDIETTLSSLMSLIIVMYEVATCLDINKRLCGVNKRIMSTEPDVAATRANFPLKGSWNTKSEK